MNQGYLVAMHRMNGRQEFETSKMGGEDQGTLSRVAAPDLVPILESGVDDILHNPPMKKAAEPDVFGCAPTKIQIRSSQNSASFVPASLRECDFQITHANSNVTTINEISHQSTHGPERAEDKVGNKAEYVDPRDHQIKQRTLLEVEGQTLRAGSTPGRRGTVLFKLRRRFPVYQRLIHAGG